MFEINLNIFNSKKITSFISCRRKTFSAATDTFVNVVSQNFLHILAFYYWRGGTWIGYSDLNLTTVIFCSRIEY